MRAHLAVLQRFIEQGLLTVVSTSLPGHDHVAGFAGMHLHEEYAELFFMNQCSSFLKGLADVVVFSRVDSLIAPVQHGRLSNILDLSTPPSPRNSSDAAASVSGVGSRTATGHLRAWKPGSIHASPVRSMFGDDSLKVYTVASLMSANQSEQMPIFLLMGTF